MYIRYIIYLKKNLEYVSVGGTDTHVRAHTWASKDNLQESSLLSYRSQGYNSGHQAWWEGINLQSQFIGGFFFFSSETGSHYIAQVGLELLEVCLPLTDALLCLD